MKKAVNLTIDEQTVSRIDTMRGLVPRSTMVDALLKRGLECSEIQVTHINEKAEGA